MNSSDCHSEREFIPTNTWMTGRSSKRMTPIKVFYSKLNLLGISEWDYNHTQIVWIVFWMKNLRILKLMCCCCIMSLKPSGRPV